MEMPVATTHPATVFHASPPVGGGRRAMAVDVPTAPAPARSAEGSHSPLSAWGSAWVARAGAWACGRVALRQAHGGCAEVLRGPLYTTAGLIKPTPVVVQVEGGASGPKAQWVLDVMRRLCGTQPIPPPPLCPSNAYVQATLGVGSVDFCTVDFGGAFFNWFYCVPCVLPDTLVLRSMKFIFCVKAALLAKRAFVSWFSEWYIMPTRVSRKVRRISNTVHFWSFTVAWTTWGGA